MKVMFTDDETEALEVYAQVFSKKNYEVVIFNNAFEAMDYLKAHSVDVILSDIFMPGTNGIEFFKHIRDDFGFKGSFSFMTGKWKPEYSYLLSEGVERVFQKPVVLEELKIYLREKEEEFRVRGKQGQG